MPKPPLTVVVSAGQSRNPEKRELERQVAEGAAELPHVHVLSIPHLYDLAKDGETFRTLQRLSGDVVLLTWMYARAAHWILDRNGVRGQVGQVELPPPELEDAIESADDAQEDDELLDSRVVTAQPRPARQIYTLDFRASSQAADFVAEIQRIAAISQSPQSPDHPTAGAPAAADRSQLLTLELMQRYAQPTNDTYLGAPQAAPDQDDQLLRATLFGTASLATLEEHPARRWYPVIDFSRCTNCMECIDFCLFGVYGIDSLETIVVEQADNCRKGCPACSRVCPQNAIIFPQHKTPAIAGAPVDSGGLKIDLSKLFGAPDEGEDATAAALRERDEQLILAGRQAVGTSSAVSERLAARGQAGRQPDDDPLDELLDQLDSLDL